jgi:hypothetical protein
VGSARRELLDHIIPLNEYHLRRLGRDYLAYYHQNRTHIGLKKATPTKGTTLNRKNSYYIGSSRRRTSSPLQLVRSSVIRAEWNRAHSHPKFGIGPLLSHINQPPSHRVNLSHLFDRRAWIGSTDWILMTYSCFSLNGDYR